MKNNETGNDLRKELMEALLRQQPQMKPMLAERCVRNYVSAVMTEIATRFAMMSSADFATGEADFGAERVMECAGQVALNGKQARVWSLMQQHPSTRLVHVVYKGNSFSGRVSRVILNPTYKRSIMDELKSLAIELDPVSLQALEQKANWDLAVDPGSLDSYIKHSRDALSRGLHSEPYEAKLIRNLTIASALKSRIRTTSDKLNYISEYWEQIDSGRMYGHGLSLQRVPKEVRHAMLGRCHKYDFKASSYALLASLATQIDSTLKIGALKEYIQHRTIIRRRIARAVGISEEWAKSIFTSLGFGAELRDNPHNSIRRKLGSDKYHALISNEEFSWIAAQLKAAAKVIDGAFPDLGFEFYGRQYLPIDAQGRKRTKNQKLAWIYQCMESQALQAIVDMADESPLLVAHDCVYYKRKLTTSATANIAHQLSKRFSLLRFEHEEVVPIHATEDRDSWGIRVDAEIAQHREFIYDREQEAIGYVSPHCESADANFARHVKMPWGAIDLDVWQQFCDANLVTGPSA